MAKRKFTREEALAYFFDNIRYADYKETNLQLYNNLQTYKMRYRRGELGEKSATRLLTSYGGFVREEFFLLEEGE